MKKIAVVTSTRAEYGLLSPVLKELRKQENDTLRIELIVTGTHLSDKYGKTIVEIDDRIDHQISIPVNSHSALDISSNQAKALVEFTELFISEKYDAVMLLGDRYETLAFAIAAGNTMTPIFHLCGGDTTEGAIDEWIRHSITKMSYLHFVTNEESRRRVIQLGEEPSRIFNYGSTSIDNIFSMADMSKEEVLKSVGLADCKYALCTYHPVTIENGSVDSKIKNFLEAIKVFPDMEFIVTKSNADQGGERINELLDIAEAEIDNLQVFTSLGVRRYLSLMKYSELVVGNSSSGIIETPAFGVPTVNIGDRQSGRLQVESIINCGENTEEIVEAIRKAIADNHKEICKKTIGAYGDGHAAERIARKSIDIILSGSINLKKKFYSLGEE